MNRPAFVYFACIAVLVATARAAPERQPLDVARVLAARYPEKPVMNYISGLSWSGSIRLSSLTHDPRWGEKARQQMLPFVSGKEPSIAEPFALTNLAGHSALIDLGEPALARKAADLIMSQEPDQIIRFARGWTDDMFMATSLLARVATRAIGDPYAHAVTRLLITYSGKLQRPDGLFVHAADAPITWGRGNGFAALALVEALTRLPESWPDRTRVLEIYRRQMSAFGRHQSDEGSWRQVVDDHTSYPELTVTAMTVSAMARGMRHGWLDKRFIPFIERGWRAVMSRVDDAGALRDVCASTAAGPDRAYYMARPVINGPDDRGAAMALLAALEVEELRHAGIRLLEN